MTPSPTSANRRRPTRVLARLATTGIYLVHGVPRDLQRAARARAVRELTTLRAVLLQALRDYAAGTWTPHRDEAHVPVAREAFSQKASRRRTSPEREAASQEAAARKAQGQTAASAAASQTQSLRQFAKSGTAAIQAHIQSRGQRRQAKRDSR